MSEPLLSVRDLQVSFGSFDAVDGISFDVHPGETLAIVGESGSGKSVSALAIMRLVELSSRGVLKRGELLFSRPGGERVDLRTLPEDTMRQIRGNEISMVFQEPLTALNPVFSIGDQVAEVLRLHRDMTRAQASAAALELLQHVRIPDAERRMKEYPHQMSGGMRQRVMIAMALACRPALLIADEPTTALDTTIQAQILGLLHQLQRETGAAVIIITHDMAVVAEVADRVVVMRHGRIVEAGSVYEIFENPQQPYTRQLLAAVPKLGSMAGKAMPERYDLAQEA